jgi:hypothetical protein
MFIMMLLKRRHHFSKENVKAGEVEADYYSTGLVVAHGLAKKLSIERNAKGRVGKPPTMI